MSSKPASSSKTTSSSSNVQSTNNKKHEPVAKETSKESVRPPSASKTVGDTQTTPVIDAAAAGVSPGASAAGNGEVASSTLTTSERPPSANKQLVTTASNENRPASASKQTSEDAALSNKVDPTITPSLGDATATTTNLRPPSASTGSRAGSASQKQGDAATTNPTTVPSGSRPGSAAIKQGETTTSNSTTEQQDTSAVPIDPNDPNITKPVIGRPGSGVKKESIDENFAVPAAAAFMPQPVDTPAAPAGPSTPRVGSASKNPPAGTS
jgi:hypothetical protein